MEALIVKRDDVAFDKLVHLGMPELGWPSLMQRGDRGPSIVFKDNGTQSGLPIAVIAFPVVLPDGSTAIAQATVTARLLHGAFSAMMGWYGAELGGYKPPPVPGSG